MNATVTYEESGWYDGQTWVKTNEVLIQDRLIGIYEVLPVINRLRTVMLTSTVVIFFITCIKLLHVIKMYFITCNNQKIKKNKNI